MLPARHSAAFRLVVNACAWPRSEARDAAARAIVAEGIDWSEVMALLHRHRVGGMVRAALAAAGIVPPPAIAQALAELGRRITMQNLRSTAEMVRLQQRFDDAGIPAIFFKGTVLAQQLYGRLDLKHSKDIDFLVPPNQVVAVTTLLEADGYRLWLPLPKLDAAQWRQQIRFNRETAMIAPATGLQVEPHWRLASHPRLLAHLDAHSPTIAVELPGIGTARTFARADLLVYLCVHGSEHGWVRLKWLADLHALLAPLSTEEVTALRRHAEQAGVGVSADLALAMCARVFALPLPKDIATRIAHDARIGRLLALSLDALLGQHEVLPWRASVSHAVSFAAAHGCLPSYVWRVLTGGIEAIRYPLPPALHFLYIAGRIPFGLWRRITRQSLYPPLPSD